MKVLAIVGPTASGKTRMGVEVALALGEADYLVEIVSCDSMAVYRGLDIAADKPGASKRRGVPHHLFDVADASDDVTAVEYRALARAAIEDIDARGSVPMIVGGSGLWFRAVVDDLDFAPTSATLRRELEAADPDELYARLREADPERAAELDPRNRRRVVRAVEILELTGRRASELRTTWDERCGPYELTVCGLTWNRPALFERATERVHREIAADLVDEVRRVRTAGISRTARQALGVKEMLEHVEDGTSLEDATATLIRNTKNFVRRQLSWFRADPRVRWVDASELGWDGARDEIVRRFSAALAA